MKCNSQPNILILFFLIKFIVSSPLTDSSTTDSNQSNEAINININEEQNDGQQSISELAEVHMRKPLFPIEKPEPVHILSSEIKSSSRKNIFQKWKPQRDYVTPTSTSVEEDELSKSFQIGVPLEDGLDNHTETKNLGVWKRLHGIPRSVGTNSAGGQHRVYSNGHNEDKGNGGTGDGGIGSIDPCPVLTFLCFQDQEYCPPMEYFCEPGSQEVLMRHNVQCILSWISGKGGANCSSIFSR